MVRFVAALAGLAMVAAGCAKTVAGSAVPDEQAVRELAEPLTAKQALGDFASINYCSLLDPRPVPADLGTIVLDPRRAFEFCAFKVRTSSGTEVEVRVGYLDDPDTIEGVDRTEDRSKTPPRGLKIERGEEDDEACVRHLRFVDDIWLTIGAQPESGKGDWCPFADTTVDSVIRHLVAKQVKHFSFGDKSLGKLDACDLVPAAVVNARMGFKDSAMLRFPTGHACIWNGRGKDDAIVRLFLGDGDGTYDLDNSKDETLAGRHSYVTPVDTDDEHSGCDVETSHVDSPDLGEQERVVLEVDLAGKGKDACGPGRELAKEVWAKLPAP